MGVIYHVLVGHGVWVAENESIVVYEFYLTVVLVIQVQRLFGGSEEHGINFHSLVSVLAWLVVYALFLYLFSAHANLFSLFNLLWDWRNPQMVSFE